MLCHTTALRFQGVVLKRGIRRDAAPLAVLWPSRNCYHTIEPVRFATMIAYILPPEYSAHSPLAYTVIIARHPLRGRVVCTINRFSTSENPPPSANILLPSAGSQEHNVLVARRISASQHVLGEDLELPRTTTWK